MYARKAAAPAGTSFDDRLSRLLRIFSGSAVLRPRLLIIALAGFSLLTMLYPWQYEGFSANHILGLAAGLMLGALCGLEIAQFQTRHVLRFLETHSASERTLTSSPCDTGLPALNTLINTHTKKVYSLFEIVKTIQQQSENILERYRVLTENLAASVVIRDAEGKIVFCSPYTEVLTGYAVSEIYGATGDFFLNIIQEEDREKYARALKISTLGEAFQFRYRIHHKTGIEMWVETRAVPVVSENGEITSSLSITLDVTAAVRYQKQVEEKNRDLQDFTYMVSHDLKAPIFTIKGMINVLEEDLGAHLSADARETLKHISQAAKRLEQLVASVLEYSRISRQENKAEQVNLSEIIGEISSDYAAQIDQTGAAISVAPALPTITGDRLKIYQIFSNLIGNALKYREPGRPLKITIAHQPSKRPAEVVISVQDNGLGIPADKLDLIFRPFQRAHGNGIEGFGIGLACVKRLLETCGGSISVKSDEGQGSVFTVSLKHTSCGAQAKGAARQNT